MQGYFGFWCLAFVVSITRPCLFSPVLSCYCNTFCKLIQTVFLGVPFFKTSAPTHIIKPIQSNNSTSPVIPLRYPAKSIPQPSLETHIPPHPPHPLSYCRERPGWRNEKGQSRDKLTQPYDAPTHIEMQGPTFMQKRKVSSLKRTKRYQRQRKGMGRGSRPVVATKNIRYYSRCDNSWEDNRNW